MYFLAAQFLQSKVGVLKTTQVIFHKYGIGRGKKKKHAKSKKVLEYLEEIQMVCDMEIKHPYDFLNIIF